MKVEGWLFGGVAIFVLGMTVLYWFLSHDPTGTTALALCFGLCFLVASYVLFTGNRLGPRPEDDPAAEISDGAGEMGFFSPYSWWPLAVAATAAAGFLGIIFGWWLDFLAAPLLVTAVIGFVFEYYRGENARY